MSSPERRRVHLRQFLRWNRLFHFWALQWALKPGRMDKKFFHSDSLESGTIRFVSSWRIQRAIVWSISREKFFSSICACFPVVGSTQKWKCRFSTYVLPVFSPHRPRTTKPRLPSYSPWEGGQYKLYLYFSIFWHYNEHSNPGEWTKKNFLSKSTIL